MKKSLLQISSLFCLMVIFETDAFSQNWSWVKSTGGNTLDLTSTVATDNSGNVYIAGEFKSDTLIFGSFNLINSGQSDLFITKYDPTGSVLWAKSVGNSLNERATAVATDDSGNVFVAGYFESDTIFPGIDTLLNAGFNSKDIFLIKYDENGNFIWSKSAGGNSNDITYSISIDNQGNIYTTGTFVSTSLSIDTTSLVNSGDYDIYIAKYDNNGNLLWARSTGGINAEYSNSIAVDDSGNSYITGYFYSDTLTFGSSQIINTGANDMFLVKYDVNGNAVWAVKAGGSGQEIGISSTVDIAGDIYVAGHFSSPNISFGNTTLTNVGSSFNIFLAKFNSSGNAIWAKSAGQNGIDYTTSVAYNSGIISLAGYFYSPAIVFGNVTLTNGGDADMFICMYDTSGNVQDAISIGGSAADYSSATAIDFSGNIYVTGYFAGSVTFDTSNITSAGGIDLFLAKVGNLNTSVFTYHNSVEKSRVFPNPFHQFTTIILPENFKNPIVSIYDLSGRLISSQNIGGTAILSAENISPGLYLYKVVENENLFDSGKLIIE